MNIIKWFFTSKYKKLLYQIECAKNNKQILHLPNGVNLDFTPGHEYDNCSMFIDPRGQGGKFVEKYLGSIEQVVHMDVYDCFSGDVLIRAVGYDRVLVEIVDVIPCYDCESMLAPGDKYWVGEWEICPSEQSQVFSSAFEDEDLPF